MAIKDLFNTIFYSNKSTKMTKYAKMLDGYTPVFSQFGTDIYASDVVQKCIDCIATECSKLHPKHIIIDENGLQSMPKSSINRLLKFSPNELMTTKDFLEKVIWQLYMNYNCFIYPMFTFDYYGQKQYTGFYPLNPTQVTFMQNDYEELFVELQFGNGTQYTIRYNNLIHLRKKFSVGEIMGGGINGQPDNEALLKVLQTNDTVIQGIGKAVKTSLGVKLLLNINQQLDDKYQKEQRMKFENAIKTGETAIVTQDIRGELKTINIDPKIIDSDTLQFLENSVLDWYGVPLPILRGDFSPQQYQAWHEKTLEPIIISLGQAFSKCLLSQRELDEGNEIRFYERELYYLSPETKIRMIEVLGQQGLLNDNQKLALFGYEPIPGGERITQSLNYVDKNIINEYQIQRKE